MIEKTTAFKVGERFFPCIEEAQEAELVALLEPIDSITDEQAAAVAELIVGNVEAVLNILTMKPTSHPKARKANGATRRPKAKPATQEAAE